jgi:hypothetical protein
MVLLELHMHRKAESMRGRLTEPASRIGFPSNFLSRLQLSDDHRPLGLVCTPAADYNLTVG